MSEISLIPKKVMFCFITEQNVTNLIPALILEVDIIIPILTHRAYNDNWLSGMAEVWNKKVEYAAKALPEGSRGASKTERVIGKDNPNSLHLIKDGYSKNKWEETNSLDTVEEISLKFNEKIKDLIKAGYTNVTYFLNLGGGTKLHTLAFTSIFNNFPTNNISLVYLYHSDKEVLLNQYKKQKANSNNYDFHGSKLLDEWTNYEQQGEYSNRKKLLTVKEFIILYNRTLKQGKDFNLRNKYNFEFLEDADCRELLAFSVNPINEEEKEEVKSALNLLKGTEVKAQIKERITEKLASRNLHNSLGNRINETVLSGTLFNTVTNTSLEFKNEMVNLKDGSNLHQIFNKPSILASNENYKIWNLKNSEFKNSALKNLNGGLLMEYFVAHKISGTLSKSKNTADIQFGIEVKNLHNEQELGEFDILILSKEGKLICLDVKNTKYDNKRFLGDKYKLGRIGGSFVKHYIVVPLFVNDRNMAYFKKQKVPYETIYHLHDMAIPFRIFTNRSINDDKAFWLIPPGKGQGYKLILDKVEAHSYENRIKCETTTELFTELNFL